MRPTSANPSMHPTAQQRRCWVPAALHASAAGDFFVRPHELAGLLHWNQWRQLWKPITSVVTPKL